MSNTVKEDRRSLADICRNYLLGSLLAGFAVTMGFKLCGFNHFNDAFLIIGGVFGASLVGPLVGLLVTRRLTFGRFSLAMAASMLSFLVMGGVSFSRSADAITAFYRQAPLAAEFASSSQFDAQANNGSVSNAHLQKVIAEQDRLMHGIVALHELRQEFQTDAPQDQDRKHSISQIDQAVERLVAQQLSGDDLHRLTAASSLVCAVGQLSNGDVCSATRDELLNARQILDTRYPVWVKLLRKLGSI